VSDVKLHWTVTQEISGMIRDGSLMPGDQLPSVRALSQSRKVSPATVLKAYEALEASDRAETIGNRVFPLVSWAI
jgi:GntR family transcriptional regulator